MALSPVLALAASVACVSGESPPVQEAAVAAAVVRVEHRKLRLPDVGEISDLWLRRDETGAISEILVAGAGKVRRVSPELKVVGSVDLSVQACCDGWGWYEFFDLDGDGEPEVLKDGERTYVKHLAAYDLTGRRLWHIGPGELEAAYGVAALTPMRSASGEAGAVIFAWPRYGEEIVVLNGAGEVVRTAPIGRHWGRDVLTAELTPGGGRVACYAAGTVFVCRDAEGSIVVRQPFPRGCDYMGFLGPAPRALNGNARFHAICTFRRHMFDEGTLRSYIIEVSADQRATFTQVTGTPRPKPQVRLEGPHAPAILVEAFESAEQAPGVGLLGQTLGIVAYHADPDDPDKIIGIGAPFWETRAGGVGVTRSGGVDAPHTIIAGRFPGEEWDSAIIAWGRDLHVLRIRPELPNDR